MEKKAKLCYIDTNSFIVYIISDDIYKDIGEDVESTITFINILRLFDVLPNLLLPQVKRGVIITYEHDIYELPHELPNDVSLRILGNYKISRNCLNFTE